MVAPAPDPPSLAVPASREPKIPAPHHYDGKPVTCKGFLTQFYLIFELQISSFAWIIGLTQDRVNTAQLTGQFEFDRNRTKNLNNSKGPNKAGHQLARTLLYGQIAGGKPHLLTTNIPGGLDPVTIGGSTCACSSTT